MGVSPYVAGLREHVGHDLILLPAVAVLIWDDAERLLLVRATDSMQWQTVGGAVEPEEDPREAAVREAHEEAGVEVEIRRLRTVLGGPDYRIVYPNDDLVSYVSIVFDAHVRAGAPHPDGDETIEVGWFTPPELQSADLTDFTVALFRDAL